VCCVAVWVRGCIGWGVFVLGSSGLLTCVRCGVLVFWGMIAGCSTSDMGRDTCSILVCYPLCCGLYSRMESLSPHCHRVFQLWVSLFCFLVRFKEFAVCSTWLFYTV
jgi:hypothetical protein